MLDGDRRFEAINIALCAGQYSGDDPHNGPVSRRHLPFDPSIGGDLVVQVQNLFGRYGRFAQGLEEMLHTGG